MSADINTYLKMENGVCDIKIECNDPKDMHEVSVLYSLVRVCDQLKTRLCDAIREEHGCNDYEAEVRFVKLIKDFQDLMEE